MKAAIHHIGITICLPLVIISSPSADAFSFSTPPINSNRIVDRQHVCCVGNGGIDASRDLIRRQRRRWPTSSSTSILSSAVDYEPFDDRSSENNLDSISNALSLDDGLSISTASSTQQRTFSTNTIINTSILLIATLIILYQVLSIDVGITRGWSPEEIATRIPLDNWRSYTNVLNMAPIQTKAVTSATVYTIGDMIAQRTEGRGMGEVDRWRVGRSLMAGLIGHGPMSHVW